MEAIDRALSVPSSLWTPPRSSLRPRACSGCWSRRAALRGSVTSLSDYLGFICQKMSRISDNLSSFWLDVMDLDRINRSMFSWIWWKVSFPLQKPGLQVQIRSRWSFRFLFVGSTSYKLTLRLKIPASTTTTQQHTADRLLRGLFECPCPAVAACRCWIHFFCFFRFCLSPAVAGRAWAWPVKARKHWKYD